MEPCISESNPIRTLYEDVMRDLPKDLRFGSAMRQGFINAISIDPVSSIVATPIADLETKEILLNETHLTYLWTVCYSVVGLQELSIVQASLDTVISQTNEELLDLITLVTNWGVSLNSMHRIWPDLVPRPDDDNERVQFTNKLFLISSRYLIFHEAAHLILHSPSVAFIKQMKLSATKSIEDLRRLRNMEIQADDYALDCTFLSNDSAAQQYMQLLGAIVAQLSNFFLLRDPNPRNGSHPDLDYRLKRVLRNADYVQEPFKTLIHLTLCIGILTFFELHKVKYRETYRINESYQTFDELEEFLFAVVERLKEA